MIQKRIPCLTVTGTWIIRWDAALVAPEDVDFAPIHFVAVLCGEQLKETRWRAAAIECDEKAIVCCNGKRGLLGKNFCRMPAEQFRIFEDAKVRFHTSFQFMC
jgi:hypothetical protein